MCAGTDAQAQSQKSWATIISGATARIFPSFCDRIFPLRSETRERIVSRSLPRQATPSIGRAKCAINTLETDPSTRYRLCGKDRICTKRNRVVPTLGRDGFWRVKRMRLGKLLRSLCIDVQFTLAWSGQTRPVVLLPGQSPSRSERGQVRDALAPGRGGGVQPCLAGRFEIQSADEMPKSYFRNCDRVKQIARDSAYPDRAGRVRHWIFQ